MLAKSLKILLVLIVLGLAGASLFQAQDQKAAPPDSDETYRKLKILVEVLKTVEDKYVEAPSGDKLIYGAIKGMVSSLDPHSAFLTPEEFKELQVETSGKFTGIGIEITLKDGILTVVTPIDGTPADKAGLKAGDRIIKVDGKLTKQMSLIDAVKAIRGAKGSKVVLTIMRQNVPQLKDYAIVRDVIPMISVRAKPLGPGFHYLRISNFQSQTSDDLKKQLDKMFASTEGVKGLILDLRNNPGGLLNQAVEVSDLFLQDGLIVYTKGRISAQNMKFHAHPDKNYRHFPMVVLVNEGSASASEIVAGALQDHRRAVIMGTRTFGKGSVQTIIPLEDRSGLRLTTARYFTPKGHSIQAKGIVPDVVVERRAEPEKTEDKPGLVIREGDLSNHIEAPEEGAEGPREKQTPADQEIRDILRRDNQLKEAFNLLQAWEVFTRSK